MLFDTHTHINFKAFKADADEVIKRALQNDVWLINVGSQYSTSQRAVEFAQKYEQGVYAAVGLHPVHLQEVEVILENGFSFKSKVEEFDYDKYKALASNSKVVAIGETGLDYCGIDKIGLEVDFIKSKQKEIFRQHLKLGSELNLPVIIHCREAEGDLIALIEEQKGLIKKSRGVIHCFMGDEKSAQFYLENNLLVSFTGLITYNYQWDEILEKIPLEKILVETDSPYLPPATMKGKRNEPVNVKYIVQRIAQIKNIDFETVAQVTFKNACELFNLTAR